MNIPESSDSLCFALNNDDLQEFSRQLSEGGIQFETRPSPVHHNILGFDMLSMQNLILAIGSAGIVSAIAKILITYLQERKKDIAIRKSDGRLQIIASNYDADDIEQILMALDKSDVIWIINQRVEIRSVSEILGKEE